MLADAPQLVRPNLPKLPASQLLPRFVASRQVGRASLDITFAACLLLRAIFSSASGQDAFLQRQLLPQLWVRRIFHQASRFWSKTGFSLTASCVRTRLSLELKYPSLESRSQVWSCQHGNFSHAWCVTCAGVVWHLLRRQMPSATATARALCIRT